MTTLRQCSNAPIVLRPVTRTVVQDVSAPRVLHQQDGATAVVPERTSNVLQVHQGERGDPGPAGPQGEPGPPGGLPLTPGHALAEPMPLSRGQPVCVVNGELRRATSAAGRNDCVGLLFQDVLPIGEVGQAQTAGLFTATIPQWEVATGMVGGLVPEHRYFLSSSGLLAHAAPNTAGEYVAPIGYALSATEFVIDIDNQVLL